MKNILINGLNAKTGGGKSILTNLLDMISKSEPNPNTQFFVLTPNIDLYKNYEQKNISLVDLKSIFKKNILFIVLYYIGFPSLIKKHKINSVLNLSNIPIPTKVHQVFLFQWAYAVYPESKIWELMDFKNKLLRKTKVYLFKRNRKYVNTFIAQTDNIKNRLIELYNIKNIEVIPNSVTFHESPQQIPIKLPDGIKLLYLSHYYPHKNFDILIPFAERIKESNSRFTIIVTISKDQHPGAENFLNLVRQKNLEEIVINIGPVEINQIDSLYQNCEALLMPTILESYGLTYVEAMNHRLPILTSDMDFAHAVCKDAAYFFNPNDATSLFNQANKLFEKPENINKLIDAGQVILNNIPTWKEVADRYLNLLTK